MLKIFGFKGCGVCGVVQMLLRQKGEKFEFSYLEELPEEERKRIEDGARNEGKVSMPIILREGQYLSKEEVM